jgi:sortase A
MHIAKSFLKVKFYLLTILSLGVLALGIGFIVWASINIGAQSVISADSHGGPYDNPITVEENQTRLTEDSTPLGEQGYISDISSPKKTHYYTMAAKPKEPDHVSGTPVSEKTLYPAYPSEGDNIGSLSIPALKQKLPIIQGTGVDELKKGIGHFIQSVLPGENDNCVLSGHRDTVFAKLGELKIGDQLVVQTSAGIFIYEINRIRIVDKDDKTVIVPADHAVLTLTTCYPFNFVGSAPDRYILVADLITD